MCKYFGSITFYIRGLNHTEQKGKNRGIENQKNGCYLQYVGRTYSTTTVPVRMKNRLEALCTTVRKLLFSFMTFRTVVADPWNFGTLRIRIPRPVPLTKGFRFGSGSCYFCQWPQDGKFFFWTTYSIQHFSNKKAIKMSQNCRKLRIKVFINIFAWW